MTGQIRLERGYNERGGIMVALLNKNGALVVV